MKKFILACAAALIALVSCSGDLKDMNGLWVTSELNFNGENVQIVDSSIEIKTKGNNSAEIFGHSGVNRFNGEIKLSSDKIDFGDKIAMTKMMGDPVSQNFEDIFINVLMKAKDFDLKGDVLTVKDTENNSFIKFTKNK